jgi:hypothetical protein
MTWKLKFPFPNPDLAHCEHVSSAQLHPLAQTAQVSQTYVAEVVAGSNRARRALVLANGEELLESAGTRNRRLVGAGVGADLVSTSIR